MIPMPLSLLAVHWLGDFVLQSDWMALNKSKRIDALAWHCLVYSTCFFWLGLPFMVATLITHFLTDFVTSRITSNLWFIDLQERKLFCCWMDYPYVARLKGNRHWFFVVIGLDQLIHATTLAITWRLLV